MEYHYCNLVSSWSSMEYLEFQFQIKETIGSNVALFMKPAFQRDSSICPQSPSVVTLSNNHFIQGFYVIRDHPQIMSAKFLDLLTTLPHLTMYMPDLIGISKKEMNPKIIISTRKSSQ